MEFASSVREFPTWQPLEIVSWETPSHFQPSPVRLETMVWPQAGSWKLPVSAQLTLASGNWSRPFPPHDRRRKSPFDEIRINAKKQSSFGGLNFHISSFNFLRKYPNPATPEAGNWKLLRAMFQPRTGLSRPQAAGLEFTSFHVCIELSTLHAYKTGLSVKLR